MSEIVFDYNDINKCSWKIAQKRMNDIIAFWLKHYPEGHKL